MLASSVVVAAALLSAFAGVQPTAKAPKPQPPASPVAARPPTTVVSNSLGVIIQRGTEQGVEVAEEGRGWVIRDGEMRVKNEQLVTRNKPVDPPLQINRFATTDDTVVVKVNISPADRPDAFNELIANAEKSRPLVLVDALGRKYEAVGYMYQDQAMTHIRYTKGSPLKGLGDAPSFSRSTPDRHVTLVFSVSLGVEIKEFRIGDAVLEKYEPPLKCNTKQK